MKAGRNDPCPCGSGRKFKQCCLLAKPIAPARAPDTSALLQQALQHHQAGRLAEAQAIYRQVLATAPGNHDALHLLGVLSHQTGDDASAVELIGRAIARHPGNAEFHNNLGAILRAKGESNQAIPPLRAALALRPDYAETHHNLGLALKDTGMVAESITHFRQAVALKPAYSEAHANLGGALLQQGGREEALACFQAVLRLEPQNGIARHMLSALTGDNPQNAPDTYVASLFDDYAERFDTHLVEKLGYRIPELLADLVRTHASARAGNWRLLDLGCGTGLVGAALASASAQMVGVDLSPKMLAKANARHVYQRLEQAELVTMMRGEAPAAYDVITAADVFIYVGKLDDVIAESARLLRPGGVLAFSVETMPATDGADAGYLLAATGRYAHDAAYLAGLAARHGFIGCETMATPIRLDQGVPIPGSIALWKLPQA